MKHPAVLIAAPTLVLIAILVAVWLIAGPEHKDKPRPKSIYSMQQVEDQLRASAERNNPDVKVNVVNCIEEAINRFRCVVQFQSRKTNAGAYTFVRITYNKNGEGTVQEAPPIVGGPAPMA